MVRHGLSKVGFVGIGASARIVVRVITSLRSVFRIFSECSYAPRHAGPRGDQGCLPYPPLRRIRRFSKQPRSNVFYHTRTPVKRPRKADDATASMSNKIRVHFMSRHEKRSITRIIRLSSFGAIHSPKMHPKRQVHAGWGVSEEVIQILTKMYAAQIFRNTPDVVPATGKTAVG